MLKIGVIRWKGRCAKHPKYDPVVDGLGGIRGGCKRCELLLDIHTEHDKLIRLLREFGAKASGTAKREQADLNRQMSLLDLV